MTDTKVPMTDPAFAMTATTPAISFDYDGLVARAKAMVEKYDGLIVAEDQVKEIKKEMAEINALKIRLDNARKAVKKQINAPVEEFEARIKKVCSIFDKTYRALGAQVDAFVQKEREEKREVVKGIIEEELKAASARIAPFPLPVQDNWLNKSTTLKTVRETVQGIIEQRIDSEAARKKAEQARAERAAAIEQAVRAANAQYGTELTVAQFMTVGNLDLETPLSTVTANIAQVASLNASPQSTPTPVAQAAEPAPSAPDITLSIILKFSAANDGGVRFLLTQLKRLCTKYSVRKQ